MPFLGANRTALIAGFAPQGPNFTASAAFPMSMALSATGVVPTYSVQRDNTKIAISNQNFNASWTAGEVNTSSRTNWDEYSNTSIYTLRLPSGYFAAEMSAGGSRTLENGTWRRISEFISWAEGLFIGQTSTGKLLFEYNSEGVFVDTKISGDAGTVDATTIENRWISIIFARGPRTSFSAYNASQGTDTYGVRVYVRDAITGELLFARDMTSFNGTVEWLDMPDFTTYASVITSGQTQGQTTLNWRIDGVTGLGFTYSGVIDVAQCWWAPGSFVDPAVNSNWVGNSLSTVINGFTAWIHATFADVYSTGVPVTTGYTHVECSATNLVTQPGNIILTAGNIDTAQFAFSSAIYPGA